MLVEQGIQAQDSAVMFSKKLQKHELFQVLRVLKISAGQNQAVEKPW